MTDAAPRGRRQPIVHIPVAILGCCALFVVIHAARGLLPGETDDRLVAELALLPARFTIALGLEPHRLAAAYQAAVGGNALMAQQIDGLVGSGGARWWTLLTCALLHAGWAHVAINCLWLVAFGWAVAHRLGSLRFLALFVASVLVASLVYVACELTSFDLVIGASGGVSGLVGALTRFILRPVAEAGGPLDAYIRRPALSLRQTFTTGSTLAFMAIFLVANALSGFVPAFGGLAEAPVAWQGHIGGFLAGLLLFPLFDRRVPAPVADQAAAMPRR